MSPEMIVMAVLAVVLIPVCVWMVRSDRKERDALSDRAVDRLRRDFEANPLGGEVRR